MVGLLLGRATGGNAWVVLSVDSELTHTVLFILPVFQDTRKKHGAGASASLIPKIVLVRISVEESLLSRGGRK